MGVLGFWAYSKMSNNVPDKIKPFGTLRDFGAGHLRHYETFLYGLRLLNHNTKNHCERVLHRDPARLTYL